MAIAHSSRRRPLPSSVLRSVAMAAIAVVTMLESAGRSSIFIQAQTEFTGVGNADASSRETNAAKCGPNAGSASSLSYVAVNSAHFAANRACGRCVQVRWRWYSNSNAGGDCGWFSNATETLRVSGQCAECSAGDLSFSVDAYSRVVATRDAGDLQDPMEIKWQFTECLTQQQPETDSHTPTPSPSSSSATSLAPTGNSTVHTNSSSPSPSHKSSSTGTVTPSPSPTLTPAAINAATPRAPSNASTLTPANTPYTQAPSPHSNSSSSTTTNSTGSIGCSTPEAGSLSDTNHQLKCNGSGNITTTTAPAPPVSTIPATPSPSPTASRVPPVPSASGYDDTNSLSGSVLTVDTKSFAVAASKSSTRATDVIGTLTSGTKAITRASGDSNDAAAAAAAVDGTSDKSTQFKAISVTTDANAEPTLSIEASSAPKKKAPTSDVDDGEVYAPSTSGSSTSDSTNKRRSNNDASAHSSRTSDDPTTSGRTNSDKLLKNPFFFSSVLLAVVGFVGAVVAYRAKARKQRRHVHQQVAWHQYSQRVQSASTHSALITPSPGGGGGSSSNMGDVYIVSSTTRHAASNSPAVAVAIAAALSPTPFVSLTPRAKLGIL